MILLPFPCIHEADAGSSLCNQKATERDCSYFTGYQTASHIYCRRDGIRSSRPWSQERKFGRRQKRPLSPVILTFALMKRDSANYLSKGRWALWVDGHWALSTDQAFLPGTWYLVPGTSLPPSQVLATHVGTIPEAGKAFPAFDHTLTCWESLISKSYSYLQSNLLDKLIQFATRRKWTRRHLSFLSSPSSPKVVDKLALCF